MYCTGCGIQIVDSANFCPSCGHETRIGEAERKNASGLYPPRRLYRELSEKKIAGVCSGFARYFDVDVTIIRLAVVMTIVFSGGVGLLAYIAAWIIMPTSNALMRRAPESPLTV